MSTRPPIESKWPPLIEDLEQWPINILSNRRSSFVEKVVAETLEQFLGDSLDLLEVLKQAALYEDRRIKNDPWNVDPANEKAFWKSIRNTISEVDKLPEENVQRRQLIEEAIHRIITVYAEEIAGKFKPAVFRLARRLSKILFKVLFTRFRDGKFGFWGNSRALAQKIKVRGSIEHVRKLFDVGTVVLLPTHSSNLDSIFLGYALDEYVGLPSPHYGAGLNLYNSESAGYFMNRMGAYRVDRRKKNDIYLQTLKTVSRLAIKLGVNSLFFPGGTRSRSGELEQELKLGLLGTTVQAQRMLFADNSDRKIFIVPVVINYSNVLEDRALYLNYLHRKGWLGLVKRKLKTKNSFIKTLRFIGQLFKHDMDAYLSLGQPMDVFGNSVDANGRSLDKQNQPISKREYFLNDGKISEDVQREMQYTRHLAALVSDSYRHHNIIRLSQLVAGALLEAIKVENRITNVDAVLKLAESEWSIKTQDFINNFENFLEKFRSFQEQGFCLLEDLINQQSSNELLIREGVKQLRTYQMFKVVQINEDQVWTDHIGLLLYYANRLECYFAYERQL
jgi:glycerol-3-phosphate O-acyltransferase